MSLKIHKLIQGIAAKTTTVQTFLDENTFPLVEGSHTTFVYVGEAAEVRLRHWVYGLPSAQPFSRIPGTDLWYHIVELPHGSRVEYKIETEIDGKIEWIRDPLNPLLAHDPFGANSVCQAHGYTAPDWTESDPEAREGTLEHIVIPRTPFGTGRRVTVYLPARFRKTRRYPLLVVHDGGDYLRYARLKTVLDNLIHRLEVTPLIAALTHPADRLIEYPNNAQHAQFIVDYVIPNMERRYPVYDSPKWRCLMGASFGAVASLSTAWRSPDVFGGLLLQSGSFAFTDIGESRRGPNFAKVVEFVNAFRQSPGRPAEKVYLSCGIYESLIYENRSIVPFLQEAGMTVRYEEARDGHNWENWRDRMRTGLSWLFPGPLWMVYE